MSTPPRGRSTQIKELYHVPDGRLITRGPSHQPWTPVSRLALIDRSLTAGPSSEAEVDLTPAVAQKSDPFLATPFAEDADPRGSREVVYLPPPTLSRLPFSATPEPNKPFSFDRPTVGYTQSVLPSVDLASWHLHLALHKFRPVSSEYSTLDYPDAFNWRELKLPIELEREWYLVVFRSVRNLDEDGYELYEADRAAHEEAVQGSGLLMYWYGIPTESGANLATCIWQSRDAAMKALSGPKHQRAMALARRMYRVYDLERWVLRKRHGRREVEILPYTGGDVGFH